MADFNSKFETYLLDQVKFQAEENEVECAPKKPSNLLERDQFPEGFFSEL